VSPLRPCLQGGCGRLVHQGSRCEVHQLATGWASYSSSWSAFYRSPQWRRLRADQLAREPQCRACGAPATHADHIIPLSRGGSPEGPLQSLCAADHRRKTAQESNRPMGGAKSSGADSRTSRTGDPTRSRNEPKVDRGGGGARKFRVPSRTDSRRALLSRPLPELFFLRNSGRSEK
jgi:hypothetical protein